MKGLKYAVAIIVLLSLSFLLIGCNKKTEPSDDTYINWMKDLKDEIRLKDVVIPGSHDAGTQGMVIWAETQEHSVLTQLNSGVRYFDVRVAESGGELKIFHSIIKGQKFDDVADMFVEFIEKNPTEFLIIDFQHFEDNVMKRVVEVIKEKWNPDKYALKSDTDLASLTMGGIREKNARYMITWGSDECVNDTDFLFLRKKSLNSPYNGEMHKKGGEYLIENAFPVYFNSVDDRLFVLQSVMTSPGVATPKNLEKKFSPIMKNYIKEISENKEILNKVNIIMRDYITSDTDKISDIIKLNEIKGNFK